MDGCAFFGNLVTHLWAYGHPQLVQVQLYQSHNIPRVRASVHPGYMFSVCMYVCLLSSSVLKLPDLEICVYIRGGA